MATFCQRMFQKYVQGPDHPAKLRIVRFFWKWMIPESGVICDVGPGLRMLLHPEDDIEGQLYRGVSYEKLTTEFLRKNLSQGDVALFAGANSGYHLIAAAALVGQSGVVVGVEPQPLSLYRAYCNIRLNHLPAKVHLISGGLGSQRGLVAMDQAPESHTGWGSFTLREPGRNAYQISVLSYEDIVASLSIDRVNFMLLDVEGYELQVLRGMSSRTAPKTLLLEVHPMVLELAKQNPETYDQVLSELGYETWTLNGSRARASDKIPENNLVCVKSGSGYPKWV